MERKYPAISQALTLFSVEVGLDDEVAYRMIDESLKNEEYSRDFRSQLEGALTDGSVSWKKALDDGEAVTVYPADEEEEARSFVVELLWKYYYPNERLPTLVAAANKSKHSEL
ncbi:hypothetical protein [Shewanella woodyi]|uniref:hypothetical protein n=1 Tax=Shewanella woodyi TaxID=60961 RepID=UPI00374A77DA